MIHHASSTPRRNMNVTVAIANPGFCQLSDLHLHLGAAKGFLGDTLGAV